jgi:hypothetical protein
MTRNEALLAELNKLLDDIRSILKAKKQKLYENELDELTIIVQHSLRLSQRSCFFEKAAVIKGIMKIINKINREITSIELEMHGVANYSDYERKRVENFAFKQVIKDELEKMLGLVVCARPEIRDKELSSIIKMMSSR